MPHWGLSRQKQTNKYVKLNPEFPLQKQHSTVRILFFTGLLDLN
jgi:hypothetical protein